MKRAACLSILLLSPASIGGVAWARAAEAAVEVANIGHNALNRGTVPLKFLVVYTGEEGKPTTVAP
ncbi:MAG: hypothetical protein QN141_08625 [Armatimonadota bacterium]|nr:hypothetical protein [Armatimonadota bacterium]MDR7452724.1 hypothetical protein [Armatimonadota bacterium]MDR7467627.1 hypothetical protein [Armatimonadota bacterium]MDR7494412.1 hypothetical protein [Armatimonadota bacterium]MDR7500443.1 hypothetical protein [Armatimonadota bacterium]